VRRGGQQHHGVRATGEQAGQSGTTRQAILVAARRDVVALIDDDDVPPGVFQIIPVLKIVLERIDRDDGAVVVVERVVIAGDAVAHPLQADRIQPHQRDRKTAPEFLLELGQHALERNHQDALPAPALDQLGGENARLERLSQTDGIGNQDPLARLLEGLQRGIELIGHEIHDRAMAQMDLVIVGCAAAKLRFEIQESAVEMRTGVRHKLGRGRVENEDFLLKLRQELGSTAAHQVGNAIATEQVSAIAGWIDAADKPLFIANNDTRARGVRKH
jgi:hypothetical protein